MYCLCLKFLKQTLFFFTLIANLSYLSIINILFNAEKILGEGDNIPSFMYRSLYSRA